MMVMEKQVGEIKVNYLHFFGFTNQKITQGVLKMFMEIAVVVLLLLVVVVVVVVLVSLLLLLLLLLSLLLLYLLLRSLRQKSLVNNLATKML